MHGLSRLDIRIGKFKWKTFGTRHYRTSKVSKYESRQITQKVALWQAVKYVAFVSYFLKFGIYSIQYLILYFIYAIHAWCWARFGNANRLSPKRFHTVETVVIG